MWESILLTSKRGNSLRRIFTYAISVFIAVFLWVLVINPSSVNAADASWSGSTITYNGNPYSAEKATTSSKPTLALGTTYYQYIDLSSLSGGEAYSLNFPSNNPSTATSAVYSVYDIDAAGNYGNLVTTKTISITPQSKTTTTTDATWKNGNLVYNSQTYTGNAGSSALISSGSNPSIPSGDQYFEYIDNANDKAYIIYFSSSVSPPTEKTGTYEEFNINPDGSYGSSSNQKTISITPVNGTSSTQTPAASVNSCSINGVGWIVCPISNFLAQGMDDIFGLLSGFLVVQPLSTQTDSPLYEAWSYVRTFANVAFVIAFLIIIYSQITNVGLTNYSMKKLLPRLIISAILVNISYIICAAAVDISNILGSSIEQVLLNVRTHLSGASTEGVAGWQSITGYILSSGTAGTALIIGGVTTVVTAGADVGALAILLIPILLGLLLSILVALIILAARQALIVILIMLAPIAFVAYLLPNTEKWFERWRKLLLDMLVFFPMFSLIFGGSQLAGSIIITNASGQINIILLGLFVQAAPLVLTPLLVRFSGEVVGKVAGLVNNPKKGILDRTRAWAQDRSQYLAAQNMARTDPVLPRQVFRRYALSADERRRTREGRKAMYGVRSDAIWSNSEAFRGIDQEQRFAQDEKAFGESSSEAQYNRAKTTNRATRNLDFALNNVKTEVETAKARADGNWNESTNPAIRERRLELRVQNDRLATIKSTEDAQYEEFKAGRVGSFPASANVARMLNQSRNDTERLALNALRTSSAKRVQQISLTNTLLQNTAVDGVRTATSYAGGIQSSLGAERALAQALTDQHKGRAEAIANAGAILEHSNLNAAEILDIAVRKNVKGVIASDDVREAAIKSTLANGVIPNIFKLLESKDFDLSINGIENHRLSAVEALKGNSLRPKFISNSILDQMTQGFSSDVTTNTLDEWTKGMLLAGKLSARELSSQDNDTLIRINEAIERLTTTPDLRYAYNKLQEEITNLKANPQLWDATGERKAAVENMERIVGRKL
jgi:hypothetical protein